jgi:hypothetical protein
MTSSAGSGHREYCRARAVVALLADSSFANECIVSVDLAGKSRPARGDISYNLGFSFTPRQFYQAMTFCRLISAMLRTINKLNFSLSIQFQKSQ